MFKKINSLVGSFIKTNKITKKRNEIERVWDKEIDQKTAKNATIVGFERGELLIKASNPTWRMELTLKANEIKKKLINKQTTK